MPDDASAGDPLSAIMAEVRKRPPDERMLARRRTADALRSLIEVALDGDIDPEALHALADDLERVLDATTLQPATSRYGAASEGPSVIYLLNETHPIGGIGNPIAMPFTPVMDGDTLRADLHFGPAYEGTPGLVHGGFVAATFDHLLGGAAIRTGRPIVTGSLTVRYLRPTPLNTRLTIECWPGKSAGRKVMTHGRLLDGEIVLVEAEALFITVDVTRYTPPAEGGAVRSTKTVSAPGSEDDTLGAAS